MNDCPTELSLFSTRTGEARAIATIPLSSEFRDRYALGEVLGAGAMGMVCRALDRSMNREVAIKFLMLTEPEILQRFLQEGRMHARIRHPNVVPVYDLEEMGGHPYIVSELLTGGTLRARIPLAPPAALEVVAACLDGLAACHASGIVHRDLKPENILFASDGTPKISDLGIAKETGAHSVTKTGALIGTPAYMAPEQARMNTAEFASDVHAMGAILFELIAGRPPFAASSLADLLRDIMITVPPSLDACTDAPLPPGLAKLVARALAKDAADRPGVEELAAALRKLAAPRARPSRPVRPLSRPPQRAGAASAPARRWPAVAALAAIAVGLACAFLVRPPPPAPASSTPAAPAPGPATAEFRSALGAMQAALERETATLEEAERRTSAEFQRPNATPDAARATDVLGKLRARSSNLRQQHLSRDTREWTLLEESERALLDAFDWRISLELEGLAGYLNYGQRGGSLRRAKFTVMGPAHALGLQGVVRNLAHALGRPPEAFGPYPELLTDLLLETQRMGEQHHLFLVWLDESNLLDQVGGGIEVRHAASVRKEMALVLARTNPEVPRAGPALRRVVSGFWRLSAGAGPALKVSVLTLERFLGAPGTATLIAQVERIEALNPRTSPR